MHKRFLICCVVALFLVHGLFSHKAVAQTPSTPNKSHAATLLKQGEYAQAYALYAKLLRQHPHDDIINLGFARSAMHLRNPGQAVMAYERLLEKYPTEPLLLKELAAALSMQNDTQRAALELAKDTSMSHESKLDLMEAWQKEQSPTQVSGKVRFGVIYDSNVNSGPVSNDLTFEKRSITLSDGKAQDTFSAYVGASLDVSHQVSEYSPWRIVGNVDTLLRYNANEKLYDMHLSSSEWVSAAVGVRYLGTQSLFEVKARAQIFDYAFEQSVFALGAESNFVYAVSPHIHLITSASINNRSYTEDHSNNGWYLSMGQYVRYNIDTKNNIIFGGRYIGGFAQEKDYTYNGFEASLRFNFVLPYHDIKISPFFSYSGEYYNGVATRYDTDLRQDYRIRTGVAVTVPLTDAWNLELSYQYNNNISNSPLYDYHQHVTNVGVSWEF